MVPGASQPQDVRLTSDGKVFYVADLARNRVWLIDAARFREVGFIRTGMGAHGLLVSRDGWELFVSNRDAGTVSVISFATRTVIGTWHIPGGGSPAMGGITSDGKVIWLSGRYNDVVYAISAENGRLIARLPVGVGPHGISVFPQPAGTRSAIPATSADELNSAVPGAAPRTAALRTRGMSMDGVGAGPLGSGPAPTLTWADLRQRPGGPGLPVPRVRGSGHDFGLVGRSPSRRGRTSRRGG